MKNLPAGTVTLLFTTIEDNASHRKHASEVMQKALARHDNILRQSIEARGGYIFKTEGHACRAAFATTQRATTSPKFLNAAIAAQLALLQTDWAEVGELKVRMALYTGAVDVRNNDYFGPAVEHVEGLLAAISGGEILLSPSVTLELADDQELPGITFHHLHHA